MNHRQIARALAFASFLAAGAAQAQDSHKFDAKKLEAAYKLPVFAPKGSVIGGEVIENVNEVLHSHDAVYEVRGDIKKAVDFFTKALGDPKTKKNDTGTTVYTFEKRDPEEPMVGRKVIVLIDPESRQVQVTLKMRAYASKDDIIEEP